jgi:two-component system response regulator FlrC
MHGGEALELLARESFDLVLSDVRMPVLDGPELLVAMRARGWTTPLIFLTGYNDDADVELIALGAAEVLAKPVSLRVLEDAIRRHALRPGERSG